MNIVFALFASLLTISLGPPPDSAPYRQPQLAAGDGLVAMVFANGGSVMISLSSDNGRSFAPPRRVSQAHVLALGRHRGPRVLFVHSEIVVSAVVGDTLATGEHRHGLPADGDLVVWRSMDHGRTWSKPAIVDDVPGAAREGLFSMTGDPQGHLAAVWLDLRNKGTALYGSFSPDGGATWSKNLPVYQAKGGTICQCCAPSLAATGPNAFAAMFRNVVAGSRDLYTLQLKNGQVVSKAAKVGAGTWTIDACPMDGGGLAYANGRLISAWRRGGDVFLSMPDAPETKIGAGSDVALAASGDRTWVGWQEAGKVTVWTSGKTEVLAERGGGFPTLVALPSGSVLAAWESSGSISTRAIR